MRWCPAGRGRREVVRGGVQGVVGHGQGVEHGVQGPVIERAHGLGAELLDGRKNLVEQGLGVRRDVHQDPAPVGRIRLAPYVAAPFERAGFRPAGPRREAIGPA